MPVLFRILNTKDALNNDNVMVLADSLIRLGETTSIKIISSQTHTHGIFTMKMAKNKNCVVYTTKKLNERCQNTI